MPRREAMRSRKLLFSWLLVDGVPLLFRWNLRRHQTSELAHLAVYTTALALSLHGLDWWRGPQYQATS